MKTKTAIVLTASVLIASAWIFMHVKDRPQPIDPHDPSTWPKPRTRGAA